MVFCLRRKAVRYTTVNNEYKTYIIQLENIRKTHLFVRLVDWSIFPPAPKYQTYQQWHFSHSALCDTFRFMLFSFWTCFAQQIIALPSRLTFSIIVRVSSWAFMLRNTHSTRPKHDSHSTFAADECGVIELIKIHGRRCSIRVYRVQTIITVITEVCNGHYSH